MFEAVEFRICDCDWEDCPGEKETVHFEHERVEECRDWILRYSLDFYATNELIDNKNRIDIVGMLPNGRKFTRKFRIQEVSSL